MQAITNFISWFLDYLPDFLMSEPIVYFIALFILSWVVKIICSLFHVEN